METQAPDIDGCVLINDVPEGFVPLPGEMVNVLITEAQEYDLVGTNRSLSPAMSSSVRTGLSLPEDSKLGASEIGNRGLGKASERRATRTLETRNGNQRIQR